MRTAGKTTLLLLAVLFSLALGEMAVRVFHLGPDVFRIQQGMIRLSPDPRIRYELVPYYVSPLRDVVINAWGMRNRPVEQVKAPGIFRIACVGDSIAFGMGTPREHFSLQLEARLNDSRPAGSPRIEVLNFGVPGYNIEQIAATLAGRVAAFAPDLVVYLYCLNDPQETSRELETTLRGREVTPAQQAMIRQCWKTSPSALDHSRLWRFARVAFASRFQRPASEPREGYRDDMEIILGGGGISYYRSLYRPGAALDRFQAGLDSIAHWSQESGIPVLVGVVPLFVELDAYALEDLHAEVKQALAARHLPALDLLPAYQAARRSGNDRFHADPLHPNREGYGIAAQAVAEVLQQDGWLRGADRQ